jgi:hypothetical protein
MCEQQHYGFTTGYTSERRNTLLSLVIIVLLSVTSFAQTDAEQEVTKAEAEVAAAQKDMARAKKELDTWNKAQVAIVCARATQDAKGHEVTAKDEADCQELAPISEAFTQRCLDKAKEMSQIANRTRDAICVAKTSKEANAIGIEGFGKVNDIAHEEAAFWRYNADIAKQKVEQKHKAEVAKQEEVGKQEVGGMAGLFGAAFLLWRWKKKRQAA